MVPQIPIILLTVLLQAMLCYSQSPCPYGFVITKSKTACYKAIFVHQTREHAKQLCAGQYDSILPMFRNEDDIAEMREAIRIPDQFHFGVNAIDRKDIWVLDDPGKCKEWIPWDKDNGQPNNGIDKCGVFRRSINKIHDYPCGHEEQVVCQLRLPGFGCGVHDLASFEKICPTDFVPTKSKTACYKSFFVDEDRYDAKKLCASYSGSILPMFRNDEDIADMRATLKVPGEFHVGVNAVAQKDAWVLDDPGNCKLWIPWDDGQPNNGGDKCGVFWKSRNKVHDYPCDHKKQIVCQLRLPAFGCGVHDLSKAAGPCPEGFMITASKSACYRAFTAVNQHHAHASNLCSAYAGSILPMFQNETQITEMKDTMKVPDYFHLGANALETKNIWVKDNPDECEPWLPWENGQPNNGNDKCAVYYRNDRKVHDYPCNHETKVVCQLRLKKFQCESTTTAPVDTTTPKSEQCLKKPVDLMILLDGSGSIGLSDFKKEKDLVVKLVNKLPTGSRVSVLQFSDKHVWEVKFDSGYDLSTNAGVISAIQYLNGSTYTAKALQLAYAEMQNYNPSNITMLTITDGHARDWKQNEGAKYSKWMLDAGVKSYAVAIGNNVNMSQLEQFVIGPYYIVMARKFSQLDKCLAKRTIERICFVQPGTTSKGK